MKVKALVLIIGFTFNILNGVCPVVTAKCPSKMLGNKLFTFCFGKIIAHELNMDYSVEPIPGFPNTYISSIRPNLKLPMDKIGGAEDKDVQFLHDIINNKLCRNIFLKGYYQVYKFYEPYKDKIKNDWLKLAKKVTLHSNPNDIVVHVRLPNRPCDMRTLSVSFDYYKKALELAEFDNVYICTDNPNHPFIDNFKPYNPVIIRHEQPCSWGATLDDFRFIMSFNKIIMGHSTFSWWAAWLSDATEIYAPDPKRGLMSKTEAKNIDLVVDEKRYTYIECD